MSAPITFYDIGLRPPAAKNCCSPNPWKTRFALNFKALAHTTKWVALPDIVNLRTTLQVAPTRKFADGSDFFTLPIIEDASTGTTLGDSLDIALTTVGFPFDPANEAATKAIFVDRARPYMTAWEDFALRGDDRARMLASYADFIVGAWLRMFDVTLPAEEWQQVRGWHGGVFGRLHDGLQAYAEVK
ncbi:hypothetical protein VdG1_04994 [Verticillium dahliae VDG1]|nr:hypothetical protein VdG1_04994 [Verticillium dahliae VDG1]